jgi:parallel beta-helix repeat protein
VGRDGISINQNASARITSNTIQNNPRVGILVTDSSSARIGFLTFDGLETVPGGVGPNEILNNGEDGIRIIRSSSAIILSNNISNNTGNGVLVSRGSHADISSNTIDSNDRHGITVVDTSMVRLGEDSGTAVDEMPNTTVTNNAQFGITCGLNSGVRGRLGTLNGASGVWNLAPEGPHAPCVNSLLP